MKGKIVAIRGAITVKENTICDIDCCALELIETIIRKNSIEQDKIISIIFSVTHDLTAAYPATVVRTRLNLDKTAFFCVQEQYVEGSLAKCIRALVFCETENEPKAVYLKDAKKLRSDLTDD